MMPELKKTPTAEYPGLISGIEWARPNNFPEQFARVKTKEGCHDDQ